jgi:transcriptional regulator with XRE-family HTH domain
MASIDDRPAEVSAHEHLGRAVRHMRRKRRRSRRQLTRACEMSWRDLMRLERGRSDPDRHLLRRLCAALGATLGTLMMQLANQERITELGGPRRRARRSGPTLGRGQNGIGSDRILSHDRSFLSQRSRGR